MTTVSSGVAAQALAILADGCDPDARRRAETYVQALPQPHLEAVFLALPILDGMVRREIHTRNTATASASECGAVTLNPEFGTLVCDLTPGHTGNHTAFMPHGEGPIQYARWP